jgi:hypothetical protein
MTETSGQKVNAIENLPLLQDPGILEPTIPFSELVREKSKVLLDSIYDEMIIWNMRQEEIPLRAFLGMTPKDYLDFMQDPEKWAFDYLMRRQK